MGFGPTGLGLQSPAFQRPEQTGTKEKLMQLLPLLLAGGAGAALGGGEGFGGAVQGFNQSQLIQDAIQREEQDKLRRQQSEERDRQLQLALSRIGGQQSLEQIGAETEGRKDIIATQVEGQKDLSQFTSELDKRLAEQGHQFDMERLNTEWDRREKELGRELTHREKALIAQLEAEQQMHTAGLRSREGIAGADIASRERIADKSIAADERMQEQRIVGQAAMPQGQRTDFRLLAKNAKDPQTKQSLTEKADRTEFLDLQNSLGKAIIADDIAAVEQSIEQIRSSQIPEDMKQRLIELAEQYLNPPEEEGDPTAVGGALRQLFGGTLPTRPSTGGF